MEMITGIIGVIALIVFFVMALALSNISKNVKSIQQMLSAWQQMTGQGAIYFCLKCKKKYMGQLSACPHCGDVKDYTPTMNKPK